MTPTMQSTPAPRRFWLLAGTGCATAALLLALMGEQAYITAMAIAGALATMCMAVGDWKTGLLRNAWTLPFAVSATVQLLLTISISPDPFDLLRAALVGVLVNVGFYSAMGLARWVGLGDVKLMIGLTILAAALTGWLAVLLAPLAVLSSALVRAGMAIIAPTSVKHRRAHGPALALAYSAVIVTSLAVNSFHAWPHN